LGLRFLVFDGSTLNVGFRKRTPIVYVSNRFLPDFAIIYCFELVVVLVFLFAVLTRALVCGFAVEGGAPTGGARGATGSR